MFRAVVPIVAIVACTATDDVVITDEVSSAVSIQSFHREHVAGDVFHYELRVSVGSSPNAALQLHRFVREIAPFVPRHTSHAAMLLHGDAATTLTNFAPAVADPTSTVSGLAPYLAAHDIDVWGIDRRWTLAAADGDISDFATMGVSQELDDLHAALAVARATRLVEGSGAGKLALIGFSHGAELAYTYAAVEGARPSYQRHVDALVALDFYRDLPADAADFHAAFCDSAAAEYQLVAGGTIDLPNDFVIETGELDRDAPDDVSPFPPLTNREVALLIAGSSSASYGPFFHELSPILDADGNPTALRLTPEAAADAWFADSPPHQSMLETADLDALVCGDAPPIDAPLSNIHVPVFYLGEAGGVGAFGLHTTTQVSSRDVTTQVIQLFGPDDATSDVGHADLLFATDAPNFAWQPITAWLESH
jgi:hypothetical protein